MGVINLPAVNECIWAGRGLGCFADGEKAHVSNIETLDGCCVVTSGVDYWNSLSFFKSLSKTETTIRTWGDAYGYALVATGRVDAMVDPIVNPWDVAPMMTIIPEAGVFLPILTILKLPTEEMRWPQILRFIPF